MKKLKYYMTCLNIFNCILAQFSLISFITDETSCESLIIISIVICLSCFNLKGLSNFTFHSCDLFPSTDIVKTDSTRRFN